MNTQGDKIAKNIRVSSRRGYERAKRVSVRTNTDAFVCTVCQQREKELMQFANPKDYYEAEMRSNYEKAINYINACHAVINETIMKKTESLCEKCSSTVTNTGSSNLSMPTVPNFMSLFNAYRQYNSFESRGTTTEEDPGEIISDDALAQHEDPQIRPDSPDALASDNEQFVLREEIELNNTQTSLELSVSDISSRDIEDKNAYINTPPSRDDTEERTQSNDLIAFTKETEEFKNSLSDFKYNLIDSDAEVMPKTIQQNLNTSLQFQPAIQTMANKKAQLKSQGDADNLQTRTTDNNVPQKSEPKILKKSTIPLTTSKLRNGKVVGEKPLANKKPISNKIKIGTEIMSQEEVDKYAMELLEDNRLNELSRGSVPTVGKRRPPTPV